MHFKSLIFSPFQESMVDLISGRHSSASFLDVFASGLLGKACSEIAVGSYFEARQLATLGKHEFTSPLVSS